MGIVSSTFASLAIQIVWNCQRLLDPRYSRCGDNKRPYELSPPPTKAIEASNVGSSNTVSKAPTIMGIGSRSEAGLDSLHQENRNRRARQLRYRKRPSSFDASLIVTGRAKSHPGSLVIQQAPRLVTSSSTPPQERTTRFWDLTSSSGCSSDSGSYLDSDSDAERGLCEPHCELPEEAQARKEFGMSAAEEAAFRLTVGRGHFSRSKKDRFLNHLRLEKRLNDMNKEFFEVACLAHCRNSQRRHSGDLHRIV